ncbi:hypothetical protein [Paracoccus homiensis]|uniref:Uncharacterized protein n=1 Tax=Paracoccus homiensis TaxID=364199 RepID=A0A1I0G954_9RHOB|nr:hypothetical protein [Paracoccus homiensis]SET67377.1 hypothetical protein SAMN04489858_10823 [Paracoccus homiensis]
MIELFFVTCLSVAPASCQDRSLLFTDEMGLRTCMLRGQSEIAKWLETHPRETLREWKCRTAREDGVAI